MLNQQSWVSVLLVNTYDSKTSQHNDNVKGNYMFTYMDHLFQTNFKSLQVNFQTVLTLAERNCCLEDEKNTFIILNM